MAPGTAGDIFATRVDHFRRDSIIPRGDGLTATCAHSGTEERFIGTADWGDVALNDVDSLRSTHVGGAGGVEGRKRSLLLLPVVASESNSESGGDGYGGMDWK